jgi:membrane associated rhomboid family serine protease
VVQVGRLSQQRTNVELINPRFITPIFLHAGIIHFALNMFAQLTLSAQVRPACILSPISLMYFLGGA